MKNKFTILPEKKFLLSFIAIILSEFCYAQNKTPVIDSTMTVIDTATNGSIKFATFNDGIKPSTYNNSEDFLKTLLKAPGGTGFYAYKITHDNLGMSHEKYQQTWRDIKVEFGEFIVHKDKAEDIVSVNGNFEEVPISFNILPDMDFSTAIQSFVSNKKISHYTILNLSTGKKAGTTFGIRSLKYELVIVRGYDQKLYLAYKTHLSTSEKYGDYIAYIDCDSGKLIFKQPQIQDINAAGIVQTIYSGARNIIGDSFQGSFRLRESNRNGTTSIVTLNYHRAPAANNTDIQNNIGNATDFIDNDNNWTAGEYDNPQHDQAALDAHWGAEMTIDYFEINHNRDSYDGNGGTVTNYVHVRTRDQLGNVVDMDNAFWNNTYHAMFYGDGLFFGPTVSLDVCGHEIGHGVCRWAVGNGTGLIYHGQSGSLNESLSDMWGASVENWATTGKQTWLIGEDIFSGGLRSMSNPNAHDQPDTYHGDNWFNTDGCTPSIYNDQCGVHTNSGVGNYWFYLLSVGGSGTNYIGNNYNISGIGIDKADSIIYRAEIMYLTPRDSFDNARNATIASAIDLYGANSCEVISATNAWYAVGVGDAFDYSSTFQISGANIVCSSNTYSISNLSSTATVSWSATPSGIVSLSPSGNQVTVSKIGNGVIALIANISDCTDFTASKTIEVGTPPIFEDISCVLNCPWSFQKNYCTQMDYYFLRLQLGAELTGLHKI